VPVVPSMTPVSPIDNSTGGLVDSSFSSMDLGMSSDPIGGGDISGGATS
jgi:hypothetical protein